ncbi:MAG: DUF1553 domain-containing protein [Verrucomicrobia bacterium]|nr:DUF1553 domain-containing protein [Verrucomicrobiota bacterium]
MPPPEAHKELTSHQKELIRQWINQGADWEPHWSFIKPERPAVPRIGDAAAWGRNPIDAFVLAGLRGHGLEPSPEASKSAIARRVYLDLIGLPPTPSELQRYMGDKSPDAYEKLVDELMRSPHWGEHRGRYWLDAARYADTHGLHFDNYREIWPYRDWVIQAFNRNKPFDQFTLEQLAGDLLPNPTVDQLVATGFHRCNPTTNEGGTIEEENLFLYARDRVETTSWVWLGLTANCAVCHDHKYDPITAKDFYSMSAFFRNTTQTGFDGNIKESNANLILVDTEAERKRMEALPAEIGDARKALEAAKKAEEDSLQKWISQARPETLFATIHAADLSTYIPLAGTNLQHVAEITPRRTNWVAIEGRPAVRENGRTGPGLQWNAGSSVKFEKAGNFNSDDSFSVSLWAHVPGGYDGKGPILSRMEGARRLRGWDLSAEHGHYSVHLIHDWPEDAIRLRTKFRVMNRGGYQHVAFTCDGSGRPEGLVLYVNGRPAEVEVDRVRRLQGSIQTRDPLRIAQNGAGVRIDGLSVQDIRIHSRILAPSEIRVLSEINSLKEWAGKPEKERKPEPKEVLADYYLQNLSSDGYRKALGRLMTLEKEREGLRLNHPVTHIQAEKKDSKPMAHVLIRGQYDKKGDKVEPAVFSALKPMAADAPRNRMGLAQWILGPENPLTARVTVNRFWQEVFGTGLVRTSEDFGIMGELPSHPELLDWLAVEFRESGWDVRHLFRLMVTSSTYRQASEISSERAEKDPSNRWLSRGPRFRMDAEMIRDHALSVSGLLESKVGGPSVRPYQPQGVWEAVAMPESNTRHYIHGGIHELQRRSLYTLWKRAAPPAGMEIFNAPNRENSCLRRERTNTPLQALATLNDVQYVEAAKALAAEALKRSRSRDGVLDEISLRVMSRRLEPKERAIVLAGFDEYLARYREHPEEARRLLGVGDLGVSSRGGAERHAAWTVVANQLLNLDETLNK